MFRGYWLAAIALGLTLSSVSTAESAKQAEPSQTKSQWQYYTGDYSADLPAFGVRILEEPEESERPNRGQQVSAQREIEDLVAQKRMANAADETVWLTKFQLILGVLGAVALIYSLQLNRMATRAAEIAVETTRETAKHELRAYIHFSDHEQSYVYDETKLVSGGRPIIQLGFRFKFVNGGATPALSCVVNAYSCVSNQDDRSLAFQAIRTMEQSSALGPGNHAYGPKVVFSRSDIEAMIREGKMLFMRYRLEYRDIFPNSALHVTDQTWLITGIEQMPDVFIEGAVPPINATLLHHGEAVMT